MNEPTSTGPLFSQRWYWTAPYVAIAVLVVTTLAIVWQLQVRESEAQQGMVVRDLQWAEKTIRLHKQGAETFLQQLIADLQAGNFDANSFNERVTRHIATQGQLVEVAWLTEDARVRWAAPGVTATLKPGDLLDRERRTPFASARDLGVISYGDGYVSPSGETVFQVHVPIRAAEEFEGVLIGLFSAERMVAELVPDWFANRYQITLIDAKGQSLAVNSSAFAVDERIAFEVPLDLPGAGLVLRAVAFKGAGQTPHAFFLIVSG